MVCFINFIKILRLGLQINSLHDRYSLICDFTMSECPIFGLLCTPQTLFYGILFVLFFYLIQQLINAKNQDLSGNNEMPTQDQTLKLLLSRRSIMPKEFLKGGELSNEEIGTILEAANWAPTHQKTEPWRYSIIKGSENIESYFDFLEGWYDDNVDSLSDADLKKFRSKLDRIRENWPHKVSHLVLIGMKREAKPDKRLPEWEEICAVAMSVQNMHLQATSMNSIGGYWSSLTWCRAANDSQELRKRYFGNLLLDPEDRTFGAFVFGKYDCGKQYRSTRTEISSKIFHHG